MMDSSDDAEPSAFSIQEDEDEFASPIPESSSSQAAPKSEDEFLSPVPLSNEDTPVTQSSSEAFSDKMSELTIKEDIKPSQEDKIGFKEVIIDEETPDVSIPLQDDKEPPIGHGHNTDTSQRHSEVSTETSAESTTISQDQEPSSSASSSSSLPTQSKIASSKPASKPKPKKPQATNANPPLPASKAPKWAPDNSSQNCTACKTPFTFLTRRHHCRRCGGLFCNDCCDLVVSLPPDYGYTTRSRVCSACFHKTIKERINIPSHATIVDGGPSRETKVVNSFSKMFYWKMGAYDGGATFDRSIVDTVENSSSTIPVQQVQDLMIDREDAPTFRVRIYTPEAQGMLPIMVWCHTGHFCTRNIESQSVDGLCRLLANHIQCIVVSVEYRLAPENKFPAAIDDCHAALVWAAKNASNLRGDPNRLAIGGDGAGGNIAAAVALLARDRGIVPVASLCCQVLVTPPLDLTSNASSRWSSRTLLKDAYVVPAPQFKWFSNQYLGQQNGESPYASPILATSHAHLPPALIITAGFDPFYSEGEAYAQKLRGAGVDVVYSHYNNSVHGFFGSGLDESDEALMEACLYISSKLRKK